MLLDKNRHNDFVALIDKIAKIEHPNATACNGLIYAIDHMEEKNYLGWQVLIGNMSCHY